MANQNSNNYNTASNSVLTTGAVTFNTAVGVTNLAANPTGLNNTGVGYQALNALTIGNNNTAIGVSALALNLTGSCNVAVGTNSLAANVSASSCTAIGFNALAANQENNNTAVGAGALQANTIGGSNTAMGYLAGSGYTASDSNTISIGANVLGAPGESAVTRIGATVTMVRCFVGGIYGTISTAGNAPMVIDPLGQVGMVGPLTDGQLVIGAAGANPVAANLTAGTGVSIINGAGQITISSSSSSGIAWATVVASLTATKNSGYIGTTGTISVGLPTVSSIGDQVFIALSGGSQIQFTQDTGQSILFGSTVTTTGTSGRLASTSNGDLINLLCTTANTSWMAMGGQGNWTVI